MKNYREINPFLFDDSLIIKEVLDEIWQMNYMQVDFPLSVKLTENPEYSLFGRNLLFIPGAVSGCLHDAIHLALGRGFLLQDEAFVIGYTMGSTKKYGCVAKNLYKWVSMNLYPEKYSFSQREIKVLNHAAIIGNILSPVNISKLNYSVIKFWSIKQLRNHLVSDWQVLLESYRLEYLLYGDNLAIERIVKQI